MFCYFWHWKRIDAAMRGWEGGGERCRGGDEGELKAAALEGGGDGGDERRIFRDFVLNGEEEKVAALRLEHRKERGKRRGVFVSEISTFFLWLSFLLPSI